MLLATALLLGERKTHNEAKEDLALSDKSRPPLFVLGNGNTPTPCQEPDGRAKHISSSNMTEEGSERVCHFTGVAEPRAQDPAVRPRKSTGRGPVGPKNSIRTSAVVNVNDLVRGSTGGRRARRGP